MRVLMLSAIVILLGASPSFAQTERGYISAAGGFATTADATSGDIVGEIGVRVAPHLHVFGAVGDFRNVQPSDVQPAIDATTAGLSANQGLTVTGTGSVPAWYSLGGLRYEMPTEHRVTPYVIGGLGFARLEPKAIFTYSSGTFADGTTPATGADVTSQLVAAGDYMVLSPSTSFMFTLGGGVDVPVARHWDVDAGYRFSRVDAATPFNAQGLTFGFGYRF